MRRVSLALLVYLIWGERNNRIFAHKSSSVDATFRRFQILFLHNFALPWKRILFLPCCCMRKVLVFVACYNCFCNWVFFYSVLFTGRKRSQSSWLSMFPSQLMLSSASFKFSSSWFFISRRIALLPLHDCMAMSWPCMFNVLEFCCWARHYGLRVFVPIYLFVLCVFLLLFLGFQLYYLVRMGTSPRIGFPV